MCVVLGSQRNNYSGLPFLVCFFLMNTLILLLFDPNNFKWCRVDMWNFFFLFGYENNFRQIFNSIWNDLIYKLIVNPNEASFQCFISVRTRLCCQFCSCGCKFIKIRCYYLMQRFLLQLHLTKYNSMSLPLLNYLCVLIEKMGGPGLHLLRVINLKHLTVVIVHFWNGSIRMLVYNYTCLFGKLWLWWDQYVISKTKN